MVLKGCVQLLAPIPLGLVSVKDPRNQRFLCPCVMRHEECRTPVDSDPAWIIMLIKRIGMLPAATSRGSITERDSERERERARKRERERERETKTHKTTHWSGSDRVNDGDLGRSIQRGLQTSQPSQEVVVRHPKIGMQALDVCFAVTPH